MATIEQVLALGLLVEHRMPDHDGRTPRRPLFLAQDFVDWVDAEDALYSREWSPKAGGRSQFEHLEQTLGDFRCDLRPLVGELNRITPQGAGIWKMHSPGLRIFGWVPDRFSFVAVNAAYVSETHGSNSVVRARAKSVREFIAEHGLDKTVVRGDRRELFRQKT